MISNLKHLAILSGVLVIAGCGFTLRGAYTFPFSAALLETPASAPEFGLALKRSLESERSIRLIQADSLKALMATNPTAREFVRVRVLEVFADKRILSLSSGGKVREFQLEQRVKYDVVDAYDRPVLAARVLTVTREYSFSDAQALAKEGEERMLREDMQADLVGQILRQLQAARKS